MLKGFNLEDISYKILEKESIQKEELKSFLEEKTEEEGGNENS